MTLSKKYQQLKKAGHIVFWLISLGFAFTAFYVASDHQLGITPKIIRSTILLNLGFAFAVYTNFYFLIPKLLKKQKYIFYIFGLISTLAFSSIIILFLFLIFEDQSISKQLFSTHFFTSLGYVLITSLAKFATDWIELQDISLRYHKVEREKLEAELETLKAQINPHFLFNSLNNIYSLALVNSEKAPELILKLSDLMRYVLYESREDFTPLKKEIEFIKNFIDLQRVRLNDKVDIQFDISGKISDQHVMSLCFEPFIDNAIKHGARSSVETPFIHISFKIAENKLYFSAINSCDCIEKEKNDTAHGIGLKNIRQRLAFLYKTDEYHLEISKKEDTFNVNLELHLKDRDFNTL